MKKKTIKVIVCYYCGVERKHLDPNSKCPKAWHHTHEFATRKRVLNEKHNSLS